MKYLLILLFLFSTQVFSKEGEADGKGIDCLLKSTLGDFQYDIMFWFNNSKTSKVSASRDLLSFRKVPKSKDLKHKQKWPFSIMDYQADADKIYWKSDWYNYILDRKSLLLIISDINDFKKVRYKGNCKAFVGYKKVVEKQNDIIEKILLEEREKEKKNKEERKGNKI